MYLSHELPILAWRFALLLEMYGNASTQTIAHTFLNTHSEIRSRMPRWRHIVLPHLFPSFPLSLPLSFLISFPLSFSLSFPLPFLLPFPFSTLLLSALTRPLAKLAHRTHNSPCFSIPTPVQHTRSQHAHRKPTDPAIQTRITVLTISTVGRRTPPLRPQDEAHGRAR
jgi:hypothetical protein